MKNTLIVLLITFCSLTQSFAQNLDSKINQAPDNKGAFKINVLSPFYSTLNVSLQHIIKNDASIQFGLSYMDFDSYGSLNNTENDDLFSRGPSQTTTTTNGNITTTQNIEGVIRGQRTQGVVFTLEYRYNLTGRGLSGTYIAPFARYMFYDFSRKLDNQIFTTTTNNINFTSTTTIRRESGGDNFTYNTLGLGLIAGYQVLFKNKVVFDFFGGPVYGILLSSSKKIEATNDVVLGPGIPNLYVRGYGLRAGVLVGITYR
jgi:hypothetical protein